MTHTILIVDDDPMIRKLITTTLEDVAGYRLREAPDGIAAVEAARDEIRSSSGTQFDPDVVAAYESITDDRFATLREAVS